MRYLCFFLPVLFFASCDGEEQKDVIFEMAYRLEFEIPAGLNTIEDHYFVFRNNTSTLDSLLSFYGYEREDISAINPKSARLTSLFSGDEFDFLHEFSLYLFKDENNNQAHEAFWRTEIPLNTGTIVDIPGTLLDTKDFFLEPKFNAELRFDTRKTTTTFVATRIDFVFVVRGK